MTNAAMVEHALPPPPCTASHRLGGQLQALLEQLAAAQSPAERERIALRNDGKPGIGGTILLPISISIDCGEPVSGETWAQHQERVAGELAEIAERIGLVTQIPPRTSIAGRSLACHAPLELIAGLATHPRVALIGLRRREKAIAMNHAALATGLGPDCEFRRKYTGKGVKIAVVDSGIDRHHPFLRGCLKNAQTAILASIRLVMER